MTKRSFAKSLWSSAILFSFLSAATSLFARERDKQTLQPSAATHAATIVIDAGHGGFDRGGIPGQRVGEKNLTLDVALRLKLKLQAAGYRVVMTRDTDVFVPLPSRVAIANSYRNAIFICIHFNSATRSGANGVETYYYRRDSASLAANIHRNVIAGAPSENRGIRRRGYYVLRKTAIPGVLVECGFLTNPSEAGLAQTIAYRDKLAEEITRGIQGKPALVAREPASRNYPAAIEVERQSFDAYVGTDFVRVPPEPSTSRHRKKSKSSHRKTTHKKTTSKKSEDASETKKKPESDN